MSLRRITASPSMGSRAAAIAHGLTTGSDHGTLLFLVPPRRCRGAGYPSSARDFDGNPPRISIYYAYDVDREFRSPERCQRMGQARQFGRLRLLCRSQAQGTIAISVSARYLISAATAYRVASRGEAGFTLVTTAGRLGQDLAAFRALIGSVRTCSVTDRDAKGKRDTAGIGAQGPRGAV